MELWQDPKFYGFITSGLPLCKYSELLPFLLMVTANKGPKEDRLPDTQKMALAMVGQLVHHLSSVLPSLLTSKHPFLDAAQGHSRNVSMACSELNDTQVIWSMINKVVQGKDRPSITHYKGSDKTQTA